MEHDILFHYIKTGEGFNEIIRIGFTFLVVVYITFLMAIDRC